MTVWFGEAWPSPAMPAPVCDPANRVAPPVGQRCTSCQLLIMQDDQGVILPYMTTTTAEMRPWHLGCFLDNIGVSRDFQRIANEIRADEGLPPLEPPNPITGYQRRT